MEARNTSGQAYRDGKLVATEIVLTERARLESTPVPITGTNRVDFKQTPIRGQSTIRFIQVDDLELEDELRQLIAAASDVDLRRRQRDERWSPKPTRPRSSITRGTSRNADWPILLSAIQPLKRPTFQSISPTAEIEHRIRPLGPFRP